MKSKLKPIEFSAGGAMRLSEEERAEVVERGQKVINAIQMRELSDILEFLDEDVFDDPQQLYYVCIDRLDENWVEEKLRYLLIRSLIETVRDFFRVRHIKIIVALRSDLLERVFRFTRDSGFQEEKYRSLYLVLRWSDAELKDLLDKRINYLVCRTYTKAAVGYRDVLPSKVDGEDGIEYMIKRTLRRPRELLEFFNCCIVQSAGQPTINKKNLLNAEADYSKMRLRSLQDEWHSDYPALAEFLRILRSQAKQFALRDLDRQTIEEFCLEYTLGALDKTDSLTTEARKVAEGVTGIEVFLPFIFHVFHKAGAVGLKLETYESYQWIYEAQATIPAQLIEMTTRVMIHPVFWRVLGIRP